MKVNPLIHVPPDAFSRLVKALNENETLKNKQKLLEMENAGLKQDVSQLTERWKSQADYLANHDKYRRDCDKLEVALSSELETVVGLKKDLEILTGNFQAYKDTAEEEISAWIKRDRQWTEDRKKLAVQLNEVTKERNQRELYIEGLNEEILRLTTELNRLTTGNPQTKREIELNQVLVALESELFILSKDEETSLDTLRRIISEWKNLGSKLEGERASADRALAELTSWKLQHGDLIHAKEMLRLLNGEDPTGSILLPLYQMTVEQLAELVFDGHRSVGTLSDRNKLLKDELDWFQKTVDNLKGLSKERANLARNQTAEIILDLSAIVSSGKTHKEKDLALHELFKSLAKLRDTYTLFESMFAVAKSMADDIPF